MISVILLIFTIILTVIGGVCGFRRGVLKEGVRTVLWGVLFVGSLFFIPWIADKLPLLLAERFYITVVDVEQLVAELLKKVDFLRTETYVIVPAAGFVRTFLVPFITIAFFWATGIISWVLYLVISLFLRNMTENQKLLSRLAGLVLGLALALFSGALTLYPAASISTAVREGDTTKSLSEEFSIMDMLGTAYDGAPVQLPYRFTGMETLSKLTHDMVNKQVILEENHCIWTELEGMIHLASTGYSSYLTVTDASEVNLETALSQTMEAWFSLEFISDEHKLLLIKKLKSVLNAAMDNEMISDFMDGIPVESKEQLVSDVKVYEGIYDLLRAEGFMEAFTNGADFPEIKEETGEKLLNKLYLLSNAETVVPEFINLIYSTMWADAGKQLVQTGNLTWNEETKMELSEVVSVICRVSSLAGKPDGLSTEDKKSVLEAVKGLKDNSSIGKENYAALLKKIMGML